MYCYDSDGRYKRTGIVVEFSDLSLRVRAPGNLMEEKLDLILDYLRRRVKDQEMRDFNRLHVFYQALDR